MKKFFVGILTVLALTSMLVADIVGLAGGNELISGSDGALRP